MARGDLSNEIAAVRALALEVGLGVVEPALLRAAHHTSLRVAPLDIVARVQSADLLEAAVVTADREVAAGRYLGDLGAPVIPPLEKSLAGPHIVGNCVVTLWPYIDHESLSGDVDIAGAAEALDAVHKAFRQYSGELPSYLDAVDRCWKVLVDTSASPALASGDRKFLEARYCSVREQVEAAVSNTVPLHGDSHLGNVIISRRGPLWLDFEAVCNGPLEWDIACLPPSAWMLFSEIDPPLTRLCSQLKSICVAVWCWADLSRSDEVRDAAEYHLQLLRRNA